MCITVLLGYNLYFGISWGGGGAWVLNVFSSLFPLSVSFFTSHCFLPTTTLVDSCLVPFRAVILACGYVHDVYELMTNRKHC